jgi:hypothetical protein
VKQLDAESYIGLSSNISANDPPPELVSPSVFSQWQFALVGIPPERVVAISTSDMPTGVGHWIEYNGIQHSFQGYGTKVRADSIRTPLKHKEYYKK